METEHSTWPKQLCGASTSMLWLTFFFAQCKRVHLVPWEVGIIHPRLFQCNWILAKHYSRKQPQFKESSSHTAQFHCLSQPLPWALGRPCWLAPHYSNRYINTPFLSSLFRKAEQKHTRNNHNRRIWTVHLQRCKILKFWIHSYLCKEIYSF